MIGKFGSNIEVDVLLSVQIQNLFEKRFVHLKMEVRSHDGGRNQNGVNVFAEITFLLTFQNDAFQNVQIVFFHFVECLAIDERFPDEISK